MRRAEHDQPWVRVKIGGKRCRVQVLDPETAFALEPRLVESLGNQLALTLAAPRHVAQTIIDVAAEEDLIVGTAMTEIIHIARLLESCIGGIDITPAFALEVAETAMFDHLDHRGEVVEDWSDFGKMFGRGPRIRWSAVAISLGVTFGPLWTRTPYHLRSTATSMPDVSPPPGVSKTRLWCEQLAAQGHAPSAHEILRHWTPVSVLESVESLAFVAERARRAQAATGSG